MVVIVKRAESLPPQRWQLCRVISGILSMWSASQVINIEVAIMYRHTLAWLFVSGFFCLNSISFAQAAALVHENLQD